MSTDLPPFALDGKPKRKKPFNATRRATDELKSLGFRVWPVESRIPHTFITRDCFGFADLLAMRPGVGVLLIQVTAGGGSGRSNLFARRRKIIVNDDARAWLASGGRIELWSYALTGKAGEARRYQLHREEITPDDMTAEPPAGPLFERASA